MFGITATLIGHEVRAYIEGEFSGVGRAPGENSVDIDLIAFARSLDSTLSDTIVVESHQ